MALQIFRNINLAFQKFEQIVAITIFKQFPPPDAFCIANLDIDHVPKLPEKSSLEQVLNDSFWWAVPKNRRTIERRLKRKYGSPYYEMKIIEPKNHLRVCNKCGHDYEVGILCPHCYKQIKAETEAMQEAIQAKLGIEPIEKDVVVLYENESIDPNADQFYKNKRVVELKKPRPSWFTKNLLQKSTQEPSTAKDVKPTQLG